MTMKLDRHLYNSVAAHATRGLARSNRQSGVQGHSPAHDAGKARAGCFIRLRTLERLLGPASSVRRLRDDSSMASAHHFPVWRTASCNSTRYAVRINCLIGRCYGVGRGAFETGEWFI